MRLFLKTLLALIVVVSGAEAKPPNILLILPDQMRASAMGCDGNRDVKTPHIDRSGPKPTPTKSNETSR